MRSALCICRIMAAAWARQRSVAARSLQVLRGKAEGVHGLSIGSDDLCGEPCLESIGGVQCGDRCNGCFVTDSASLGGAGGGRRETRAQCGEYVAGDGGGEIRQSMHGDDDPLE